MNEIAIRAENLGKRYRLGENLRYRTLRESWGGIFGRQPVASDDDELWALKDISFEVKQGDLIGVIGRNGAGKSTLLKILSRITRPTRGMVDIHGRVGSLLEVGTGFHPELTGRENIFLNGSILGMTRREVQSKFDEIVSFAETEKFLDTPVKRYSSGMYVRLAFAVAAHLDPEILLVDEVLAVGDAQFQKKCLGKMQEAGKAGRTVLFVSHNMGTISQLCSTCIWLDKGTVREIGRADHIIGSYMLDGKSEMHAEIRLPEDAGKTAQLKRMAVLNQDGKVAKKFDCDGPVTLQFDIQVNKRTPGLYGYIGILKSDGTQVLVSDSFDGATINPLDNLPLGSSTFNVTLPPRTLGHGEYRVHFSMASSSAENFHVDVPGIVCGFSLDDFTSKRGNRRDGYFSTLLPWRRVEN